MKVMCSPEAIRREESSRERFKQVVDKSMAINWSIEKTRKRLDAIGNAQFRDEFALLFWEKTRNSSNRRHIFYPVVSFLLSKGLRPHSHTHEKLQLNATFDFGRCWIQRLLKRGAGAWSSFWLIDWCGSPPRCRRRIDGVFRSWIKESRDCQHPSKQSHSVHQWSEQLFLLVCTAKMTSMMSLLWFCSLLHCSARG